LNFIGKCPGSDKCGLEHGIPADPNGWNYNAFCTQSRHIFFDSYTYDNEVIRIKKKTLDIISGKIDKDSKYYGTKSDGTGDGIEAN
jgi:hypothetical protein